MNLEFPISEHVKAELAKSGISRSKSVKVRKESYDHFLASIRAGGYQNLSEEQKHALAIGCCMTHPDHKHKHKQFPRYLYWLIPVIVALAVLLFMALPAHAQGTSQIDVIQFQNSSGVPIKSFAAPFKIKCSTNVTCSALGSVLTLSAAGGGGGGGYSTIQNGGVAIAAEAAINFLGSFSCVDNPGNTSSDCKLTASAAVSHEFVTGVDSSGNYLRAVILAADVPTLNQSTSGNAATATALAANPTDCSANQYADAIDASGNLTCAQVGYGQLTSVPTTFAPTAHALLSATHSDTTAAAPVRGDGLFAIGTTPTWQRLAHPSTTGGYFKWNGTDEVASTGAASGTGACTNQFASTLNADAAPTCTSVTQATMAAGAINWAFCGTTNGAVNELTPVNAATCCNGTTCREFMIHYLIVGYSAGAVGRLLMGPGTPSTTAGTNGSGLREVTTATATDVSTAAVSIPGIPLAITVTAIARDGWIMIDGASGSLKSININGLEGNPSVSAAPTIFQGVGWFSDLSTNAPLQQFTLGVYATLATTALAATTFSAGTRLDVWGRNGN